MADEDRVYLHNLTVREASITGPSRGYFEALLLALQWIVAVSNVDPTLLRDLLDEASAVKKDHMQEWYTEGMPIEVLEVYKAGMLDGYSEFMEHIAAWLDELIEARKR